MSYGSPTIEAPECFLALVQMSLTVSYLFVNIMSSRVNGVIKRVIKLFILTTKITWYYKYNQNLDLNELILREFLLLIGQTWHNLANL